MGISPHLDQASTVLTQVVAHTDFQPSGLDVERSIQFHEPHPAGKIPFRVARRIGRRLERAYGWVGGMFALRGKE
jgi:hypothetical protein